MKQEKSLADTLHDESASAARTIRRAVKAGCCVNLLLMAVKIGFGVFGHSDALVADGLHSINDIAADLIMLFFVGLSYRHANDKYPYGYGKFQTFATLLISSLLVLIASLVAYGAVESMVGFFKGDLPERPDVWTIVAVLFAMACKEGLFRYYSRVGHRVSAPALIASAWHHRSDALASVATLTGVGLAHFLGNGFLICDPLASLLIAVMILVPALRMIKPAFFELMDRSVGEVETGTAVKAVGKVPGVKDVESCRARRNGHVLLFDINVKTDPDMTVATADRLRSDIIKAMRGAFCPHVEVNVALSPANAKNEG